MSLKRFSLALLVVLLSVKMAEAEVEAAAVDEKADAVDQADGKAEAVDQAVKQADEMGQEAEACCKENCASYRGTISMSEDNLSCLPWDESKYTPENYPDSGLDANYCRNPSDHSQAWCYVKKTGSKKWRNCKVPTCAPTTEPACCKENCASYRGTLSMTEDNLSCLPWDESPSSKYTPENYPDSGLDANYCRNPSDHSQLWCYVKKTGKEWRNCKMPTCAPTTEPALNPTIKTYHPFKENKDAKDLYKAMKGAGTTESTIIKILTHRTYYQRNEIAKAFKSKYDYNFRKWLFSEISGTFKEIMWDLMYLPTHILASQLVWAVKGAGTHEQTLIEILVPLNKNDFLEVETQFKKKSGGTSLRDYVRHDTSGPFRDLLTKLIDIRRPEDEQVDVEKAKEDAKDLHEAMENNKKAVDDILTARSWAHLKTTFDSYAEIYGTDSFNRHLPKYTSGYYQTTVLAIYQYAMDSDLFFAKALRRDLRYINRNSWGYAKGVARVFTWRSEIDLGNIAQAYQNFYRKSLVKHVKYYAKGDAEDTLVGILQ